VKTTSATKVITFTNNQTVSLAISKISSSGDFSWSYPIQTPPSLGGPAPQLALSYSSGSVDGRTTATNNQPSWAGEGFDFAPGGYIERRYPLTPDGREQRPGADVRRGDSPARSEARDARSKAFEQ